MTKRLSTLQRVFNRAYRGLRSQGFQKSMIMHRYSNGSMYPCCAYRGDNGCRCAIGWNIPDSKYNSDLEGNAVASSSVITAMKLRGDDWSLTIKLQDLQNCHDDYNTALGMRSALEVFAAKHNLTIPN